MLIRGSALVLKFGLSFYLARYLDLNALGVFGMLVGASLVVPTLFRAGLTSTITRALVNAAPPHIVHTLKHYLLWVAGCYLVSMALLVPVQQLGGGDTLPFNLYVVWLVILAEHLAADLTLLLNNLHQIQTANTFGLLQTAVWVLPFCGLSFLYPTLRSMDVLLWFWALGTSLAVLVFSWPFSRWNWRNTPSVTLQWYITHLRVSGYLFLSDLTGSAAQFVDRYLIALLIDVEHAGVYTLFFQLANAVYTLVSSSIVNLHRPGVLSAFHQANVMSATTLLRTMQKQAVGSMLIMSLVVGVAFQFAAPLLNRPMVLLYLPLMWLTFAATAIKTWCLTDFIELFARRLDRQLFLMNVLILALVALGCYASIPWMGIYGIPLSTGLAYLLILVCIRLVVYTHVRRVFA
jgi:O-antigen/teichoic acid export membrane protein